MHNNLSISGAFFLVSWYNSLKICFICKKKLSACHERCEKMDFELCVFLDKKSSSRISYSHHLCKEHKKFIKAMLKLYIHLARLSYNIVAFWYLNKLKIMQLGSGRARRQTQAISSPKPRNHSVGCFLSFVFFLTLTNSSKTHSLDKNKRHLLWHH